MSLLRSFQSLRSRLGLAAAVVFACALAAAAPVQAQTMVRLHTNFGPIDMRLADGQAPNTVANFLAYVRGGDYVNDFIHRSAKLSDGVTPFVIQGGGFTWSESNAITAIPSRGNIPLELAGLSNVRGTVAMARSTATDSANSQWFINLGNNSFLDTSGGGYAVFGRVTAPGMAVADNIASLQRVNAGAPFNELPVYNFSSGPVTRDNVVIVFQARELPAAPSTNDRIFNYLEAAYPQYLWPSQGVAGEALGYQYRYYPTSNAYVGIKDGHVDYLVPAINGDIHTLGAVSDWLGTAQAAGY